MGHCSYFGQAKFFLADDIYKEPLDVAKRLGAELWCPDSLPTEFSLISSEAELVQELLPYIKRLGTPEVTGPDVNPQFEGLTMWAFSYDFDRSRGADSDTFDILCEAILTSMATDLIEIIHGSHEPRGEGLRFSVHYMDKAYVTHHSPLYR